MTPQARELLDYIAAPHTRCCEVCDFMDDESCHRNLGRGRRIGRPHAPCEDPWIDYEGDACDSMLWELERLEQRMDIEWHAYLTKRHGPSDVYEYAGPIYRGSANGYCNGKRW